MAGREFNCRGCGAPLVYKPGTSMLSCASCGGTQAILKPLDDTVDEIAYLDTLHTMKPDAPLVERVTIHCNSCGANVEFPDNVTSTNCPYCGTPQVATKATVKALSPTAVLPFFIDDAKAHTTYAAWLKSLWWAPSNLIKTARIDDALLGVYMPFYTYDSKAFTLYTGQRGEDYWDTETFSVVVSGRSQMRTRQVRKTRWFFTSGQVSTNFDDVLVIASGSLPTKRLAQLEPWDLANLVPYVDEYLSGFRSETYAVALPDGFKIAQALMQPGIEFSIRNDIGGDQQRISTKDTRYENVTFKHILLPVWVAAYRYNGKVFRILINARTGELTGERPYSWVKITLAIIGAILAIALIVLGARFSGG